MHFVEEPLEISVWWRWSACPSMTRQAAQHQDDLPGTRIYESEDLGLGTNTGYDFLSQEVAQSPFCCPRGLWRNIDEDMFILFSRNHQMTHRFSCLFNVPMGSTDASSIHTSWQQHGRHVLIYTMSQQLFICLFSDAVWFLSFAGDKRQRIRCALGF